MKQVIFIKVIFLDIDGVLNTAETYDRIEEEYQKTGIEKIEIDEFRLKYLKKIITETGAIVVLSSSWIKYFEKKDRKISILHRKGIELAQILASNGIYLTDMLTNVDNRQEAIKLWINNHKYVESFIILDDDSYGLIDFINNGLIKTSNTKDGEMVKDMSQYTGLCEHHIEQAINLLNNKKEKNMEIYNKLVRDNIDEIINNNGKGEKAFVRILNNSEYKQELLKKLHEEFNELLEALNMGNKDNIIEESSDLIEVIRAINNDNLEEILIKMEEKRAKKGGFAKRKYLEKVEKIK